MLVTASTGACLGRASTSTILEMVPYNWFQSPHTGLSLFPPGILYQAEIGQSSWVTLHIVIVEGAVYF